MLTSLDSRGAVEQRYVEAVAALMQRASHRTSSHPNPTAGRRSSAKPFRGLDASKEASRDESLADVIGRISQYSACSSACFAMSLIYMEDLLALHGRDEFAIDRYNVNRLSVLTIMIAAKFYDDKYVSNKFYAALCPIKLSELNKLEKEFLFDIRFQLKVSQDRFIGVYGSLVEEPLREICVSSDSILGKSCSHETGSTSENDISLSSEEEVSDSNHTAFDYMEKATTKSQLQSRRSRIDSFEIC